eukprot:TRINITY_DN6951_c0_g1_i1.p1 TRINITY_DN6951_c0_g1~~TRINITY_DN6951_c0_g1_i1.p1  ORF type:complete len:360 (-),score=109.32 TRINITY_DN6951_c0_g1_i1:88-1167(-)
MAGQQRTNKAVILKALIDNGRAPSKDDFDVVDVETPTPREGEILIQTLYVSVDPYLRLKMRPEEFLGASFEPGKPWFGVGVGRVIESKNAKYAVGDVLTTQKKLAWPFQLYFVFDDAEAAEYTKLDLNKVPKNLISATVGFLGMAGLTAYFGLLDRGKPKAGETIVISGAAGACGSVAGQIARIKGLRTIGIVGTQAKADYITKELGYDAAVIYKDKTSEQIEQELRQLCPNGVDIYYDNVGGDISNVVLKLVNKDGRVPICGQISQYHGQDFEMESPLPEEIVSSLKEKRVERGFFIVGNYAPKFEEGWTEMLQWVQEGKLKIKETLYHGIENVPTAFLGLFVGDNIGKAVIQTVEDF